MAVAQSEGPLYPDVEVRLSEEDGNAFFIMGRVSMAIRLKHGEDAAREFVDDAKATGSYDELLRLVMATVVTS